MSIKQELILLLCYVFLANATQTRILVNCDRNGFTCKNINSKRSVVYQCPPNIQDVIAHIWNYGEPSNTAYLSIKNCENVEIDMSCTSYRRSFESMTIENVTNLVFTRTVTTIKNPSKIVLKNVRNIDTIPENTFSVPHMVKYNGEASQHELQEIEFDNVNIGTIEGHAFHSLRGFRNFKWNGVKVDRLHANAIKISFNTTDKYKGYFNMSNSSLEIMEYLSFQLYVKGANFSKNKFVEIMPGGINGTIEHFEFSDNVINTLQSGSISILSQYVAIRGNTFDYLKSGSFEKISPGLLVDSHTNFGNLKFVYDFHGNKIQYLDAGSLNPDLKAYDKVSTEMTYSFNRFFCTCRNIGWLVSPIGHGHSSQYIQKFYESLIALVNSNICWEESCQKKLFEIESFLKDGKCLPNLTMDDLCRTTTESPSTSPSDGLVWWNKTNVSASSHHCDSNIFFVLILSVCVVYFQYYS